MAGMSQNEYVKYLETKLAGGSAPGSNMVVEKTQSAQASPYTGLSGVSESTQNVLGKYSAGYTPSQAVSQAQQYLNKVVSGKPANYQSSYKGQLDDLYNQVMNRQKFSYDVGSDPLYAQYRDQYMNLGNQAMMDTTAQAAALTGGYGNSYAATAGNQAYQAYLQQLNNVVPDLYQMALQRYQQEGDDLNTKYALTADLENKDYGRYQDDMARWESERNFANSDYWNQYNADYGQYGDALNYWSQMAAQENAQWNTNRELAYNQAMALLTVGKTPSSELLEAAGISSKDAKNLAKAYKPKSSGGGGGGSSSKSSSGSSSGSKSSTQQKTTSITSVSQLGTTAKNILNGMASPNNYNSDGTPKKGVIDRIESAYNGGNITAAEADYLLKAIGQ